MILTKDQAQNVINHFGISYSRNECALTIYCLDNNQTAFEIVQFNNGFVFLSRTLSRTLSKCPALTIDIRI